MKLRIGRLAAKVLSVLSPLLNLLDRWIRNRAWRKQSRRIENEMAWTIAKLRPRITPLKGRPDLRYSSFELVFDRFRVQIILDGTELDEFRLVGASDVVGTRVDHVQRMLVSGNGLGTDSLALGMNYADLDEFLRDNYSAIEKYYSRPGMESTSGTGLET
jgi:hypothetical protein